MNTGIHIYFSFQKNTNQSYLQGLIRKIKDPKRIIMLVNRLCSIIKIALSIQLVRFLLRNIASGSCTCEEQFQSCDSLRPIRLLFKDKIHSKFKKK